jgi:hypothetical protein
MKFKKYLTEREVADFDNIIQNLKKSCKPAIDFYKRAKSPLWRGMKHGVNNFVRKAVRNDRRPRVVSGDLHKVLDDCFKKHFGWKARSEGVFSGSEDISSSWGMPYIIFPIGKFDYVYTIDPMGVFWEVLTDFESLDLEKMVDPDVIVKEICDAVKFDYHNKGLESVLKSKESFESIIKCKEYYAVASTNRQTFDYIMERV